MLFLLYLWGSWYCCWWCCCFYCTGRYYCLSAAYIDYTLYLYSCVVCVTVTTAMIFFSTFFLTAVAVAFIIGTHIAYLIVHWKIKNPWVTKNAARIEILTIIQIEKEMSLFLQQPPPPPLTPPTHPHIYLFYITLYSYLLHFLLSVFSSIFPTFFHSDGWQFVALKLAFDLYLHIWLE